MAYQIVGTNQTFQKWKNLKRALQARFNISPQDFAHFEKFDFFVRHHPLSAVYGGSLRDRGDHELDMAITSFQSDTDTILQ